MFEGLVFGLLLLVILLEWVLVMAGFVVSGLVPGCLVIAETVEGLVGGWLVAVVEKVLVLSEVVLAVVKGLVFDELVSCRYVW